MIVCPFDGALRLITQPDHAHLAARIMERCVPLMNRRRRAAILYAIAEHDNGWEEPDAAPIVNPQTGNVEDFVSAPLGVRQAVWPRGVARLSKSPYAAALVAQHAITIYDRFRIEAEWAPFFNEMESVREAMLRASGLTLDDLFGDYPFVRLADLISLTFCIGWTDEQRLGDWTVRLSGTQVVVTPDAWGGVEIPIEIAARVIPNHPFQSDAALREALRRASSTTLRGLVTGQQTQPAIRFGKSSAR